jgi:transcriptional regulator with XRE-family HTH domain
MEMTMPLKSLRVRNGLNLRKASNLIGIGIKDLRKFEIDSSELTSEQIMQIAYVYRVPHECIWIGKEKELFYRFSFERSTTNPNMLIVPRGS